MLTAIVLAAGRSTRMGMLKQLLPFGDTTIIERVVTTLLSSRVDHVTVVLGYRVDEIRPHIDRYPVTAIVNPDSNGDMLSSIQCGVNATAPEHALLIAPGDQPFITPYVVNTLIESYTRQHPGFVIPVYEGRRGHPMIIDARYRDEILSLQGAGGLKNLRDRYPDAVVTVPVDTDDVLIDLDFFHDYELALKRLAEEGCKPDGI